MKKLELLPPPQYLESLAARLEQLKTTLKALQNATVTTLGGELRISVGKYGPQYYLRKSKQDKNGKYLHKTQMAQIKQLAQQRYNLECIAKIEEEIGLIEGLQGKIQQKKIFGTEDGGIIQAERRALLETATLPHAEYAEKWQNISYKGKETWQEGAIFQTARGEKVRSKSEVMIADTLQRFGVPYKYEYPLKLRKFTAYPDFYCLNLRTRKEYYWEHFGLMDNVEYAAKALEKLMAYENENYLPGENLIVTMEANDWILTPQRIEKVIFTYLK